MLGWIVVGLFVVGLIIVIYSEYQSEYSNAPADMRMGWLFPMTIGGIMIIASIMTALIAGIAHLF